MNPLYKSYQESQAASAPPANLNEMLQSFAEKVLPKGMTPEQMVRQMIQNGQMTQAQFDQLASVADRWTGRRR